MMWCLVVVVPPRCWDYSFACSTRGVRCAVGVQFQIKTFFKSNIASRLLPVLRRLPRQTRPEPNLAG
eukprot:scaffold105676_cov51-Phaeocystis_antarctica.AAC.1